ncbi:DUF817 domain-containing protein [Frateuria sp. STR12]|uniref:DUF817 domain-containing protein n=1 Tax=Frateuria hangzhouensis TaxID=2995589 RepID=UPI002260ADDF|nr:DUF817 domain-containing protein [Frateuria sp. STR12]MCX7513697.1 DUF817 domain-containing protein [Frateuria sp. STR12]
MDAIGNPDGAWRGLDRRVGRLARRRGRGAVFAYEFLCFGLKQASACLFGGLMVALLLATWRWYPADLPLARYDFLVLAALGIQLGLLACRLESLLRLGGVPLFTGFMYAAVGSYIARAWRLFEFRFSGHPRFAPASVLALALAIYLNFFSHHFLPDARLLLFAALAWLFGPAWVHFRIRRVHRRMPLLSGFVLVALFIWLAENVGTFSRAWLYPAQRDGWSMVPLGKLGSWLLLMVISYVMVWALHRRGPDGGRKPPAGLHFPASTPLPPAEATHVPDRLHDRRFRP